MRIAGFIAFLAMAVPAHAADTTVPEPSALALFGIGVLGVIIGRHGSRRKRD
ncbi:PEP-CTERM sorting domain-containing protein [Tsuneonella sp. YG55]|uniref:PEP-CTERM sorting domain-containing protein n=1 Tax=Tsuneonella litorea TaxID=2976475 RepID=A0A9X2W0B8_9SPHN|nr:PEP-CTERM sorting domain-containing protein [Tsuneonella litorea]MCT2558486.1 PEP-CTERM sorting domain-containing protein [Tsuneonella litorea]